MNIRIIAPLLVAAALPLSACSSAEDQAAKARIFSPEDPPRELQAAAEKLDVSRLVRDGEALDRILAISAREAAARVGPHVQKSTVRFDWEREGKKVGLKEERMVALGQGGDFHVRIENDERQGMEWVKVNGVSYARSRYAPFRERRRDRGSSEHVVASAYATLDTFRDMVQGAIQLTDTGAVTLGGRSARKYTVSLGKPQARGVGENLPAPVFPKDGPDPDTALRLEALEKGRPEAISGTLVVDEATAVPLQADLSATVSVPGEQGTARLRLTVKLGVEGIGAPAAIQIPEHIEDAPRSPGVVATLKAYGISGEAPPEEAEPEDE